MVQFSVKLANATKTAFSTLSKEQTRMSCSIFSELFTFQNGHFKHLQRGNSVNYVFFETISSKVIKVALIKKSGKINGIILLEQNEYRQLKCYDFLVKNDIT